MRFIYGDNNAMRALDEVEFWKHQEGEHTDVIQEISPDLEEEYISKLNEYKEIFNSTEARITQYIETLVNYNGALTSEIIQYIMQLIDISTRQSQVFVNFIGDMLKNSEAIKNNPMAVVVANHIRRESEYFIGLITAFLSEDSMAEHNNDYNKIPGCKKIKPYI